MNGEYLIICYKTNCIKCNIIGNVSLVQITLNENLPSIIDENGIIGMNELKKIPVIDYEKQKQIKNYIDDLVFALYFKIKLTSIGFSDCEKVHTIVSRNKYYELIKTNLQ